MDADSTAVSLIVELKLRRITMLRVDKSMSVVSIRKVVSKLNSVGERFDPLINPLEYARHQFIKVQF